MTRNVDDIVIGILSRAAEVPSSELSRDRQLSSLGFGSLDQIECVLALEDALQIEISEADARGVVTVQDLIDAAEAAVAVRQRTGGR